MLFFLWAIDLFSVPSGPQARPHPALARALSALLTILSSGRIQSAGGIVDEIAACW
jgi:hypothetical protein